MEPSNRMVSEGRQFQETRPAYQDNPTGATMGHYTMESVPLHIRIDHPNRHLYTSGQKLFGPRIIYSWKGEKYVGTSAICEATGKCERMVMQYIARGVPVDGCVIVRDETRQRVVKVRWKGVEYATMRDFADAAGISYDAATTIVRKKRPWEGELVEVI